MTNYLKKNAYKIIMTILVYAIIFLLFCYLYIFLKNLNWIFWSAISTISIIAGNISYNIMKNSTNKEIIIAGAIYAVVGLVFYALSGGYNDMFICTIVLNLIFFQGFVFLGLNLLSLIHSPV